MMVAMSGDGMGSVRRPRVIERPVMPAGPLADLKALVYELYLAAGAPTLDDIACWIAADDRLAGAPERDTVRRIIKDTSLPPSQADVVAVVAVLARAARWDPDDAAVRARDLWVAARMTVPVGTPLDEVLDPFALEVHRPITHGHGLPLYVRREHDDRLADVVTRALAGRSGIAVLVAGSSTGKTRACWEALAPLRAAGGWRLWHPLDPTRAGAALAGLDRVGPRTVVWMNEAQDYLGGDGEPVAARLRTLLADRSRAPVLVLGTLWPEHHATLTQKPGTQVRQVLDGTVITVPNAFTGAALHQAAVHLAWAVEKADAGQVTQYLAGGPELITRYETAPPAAKALMTAAMDALRMGHGPALPLPLLTRAAPAYLTDAQWDQLEENWLADALVYTTRPCKGARGPLTRNRPTRSRAEDEQTYRLADYLDQYGRAHRVTQIPPPGFWAAAGYTGTGDMATLAQAAQDRGLYRDAAQLHKDATVRNARRSARDLVDLMTTVSPGDPRPARWAVEHVAIDNPRAVEFLLEHLNSIGATELVAALTARNPAAHTPMDDVGAIALLLLALDKAEAADQVATLLARDVAAHVVLDEQENVDYLLQVLHRIGATEQVTAFARRAAAAVAIDSPFAVGWLLYEMLSAGVTDQVAALLARNPATHMSLDNPEAVGWLLSWFRLAKSHEQIAVLLARDPVARVQLDNSEHVEYLAKHLLSVAATEQLAKLVERATEYVDAEDPGKLVVALHMAGAAEQVAVVAARAVETVALADAAAVARLLRQLRTADATSQIDTLLTRDPALHTDADHPYWMAELLSELRDVGAAEQVARLARRAANNATVDEPEGVGRLLRELAAVAPERVGDLLARNLGEHAALDMSFGVGFLLKELHKAGATKQFTVLLERAVAHATHVNPEAAADLVGWLADLGITDHVATLQEHLPALGRFTMFIAFENNRATFRYGREADGTPSPPWTWDDLN